MRRGTIHRSARPEVPGAREVRSRAPAAARPPSSAKLAPDLLETSRPAPLGLSHKVPDEHGLMPLLEAKTYDAQAALRAFGNVRTPWVLAPE